MTRAGRVVLILIALAVVTIGVAFAVTRSSQAPVPPPPEIDFGSAIDPMIRDLLRERQAAAIERPDDATARRSLANALCANGLFVQAIEAYRQTLQLDSSDAKAWHGMARAHARLGEVELSLHAIESAIEADSDRPFLYWQRACRLLELGRLDDAEQSFREAMVRSPGEVPARVGLARVLLLRGRDEDAESTLVDVLANNPQHPNYGWMRQLLGIARRNLGKADDAIEQLAQASGQPQDWRDPWSDEIDESRTGYESSIESARTLVDAGQISQATALLDQVLLYKPEDVGALNYLSMASFRAGNATRGFELLQRALAADPDHYATHLNLSRAYQAGRDSQRAMDHARRAVQLNPGHEEAHQQIVQLLLAQGNDSEAAAALEVALESGVSSVGARAMLGRIQLRLQRWCEAQRTFESVLRSNPDHAGAHLGAAVALAEQGSIELAMEHLQLAEQLGPHDPQLPATAARVRSLQSASQEHE